jgi:hypothetical protein
MPDNEARETGGRHGGTPASEFWRRTRFLLPFCQDKKEGPRQADDPIQPKNLFNKGIVGLKPDLQTRDQTAGNSTIGHLGRTDTARFSPCPASSR